MWAQPRVAPVQGDHRLGDFLPSSLVEGSVILSPRGRSSCRPCSENGSRKDFGSDPSTSPFSGTSWSLDLSRCFGNYLGGLKKSSLVFIHSFIHSFIPWMCVEWLLRARR